MTTARDRRLPPEQLDLKIATAAAMKAAGGQVYLTEITRRAQSSFSDWGSKNTSCFAPIDLVATIEEHGHGAPGWPHVTRALARRQGFDLFQLPPVEALETEWGRQLASLAKEAGEVMARLGAALSDDQDVDRAEALGVIPDARELVSVAVALLTAIETRAGVRSDTS